MICLEIRIIPEPLSQTLGSFMKDLIIQNGQCLKRVVGGSSQSLRCGSIRTVKDHEIGVGSSTPEKSVEAPPVTIPTLRWVVVTTVALLNDHFGHGGKNSRPSDAKVKESGHLQGDVTQHLSLNPESILAREKAVLRVYLIQVRPMIG